MTAERVLSPLIKNGLFANSEDAARALLRNYMLQQIETYRQQTDEFQRKHGMTYEQFSRFTAERTAQLRQRTDWSEDQRVKLSQLIMQDEEDWLEWKAADEMLQSWLGLKEEPTKD